MRARGLAARKHRPHPERTDGSAILPAAAEVAGRCVENCGDTSKTAGAQSSKMEINVDIENGGVFNHPRAANAEACRTLCLQEPRCKAWSYYSQTAAINESYKNTC